MIRKIVQIEEDRCTGCGLCAHACHESAIAMVDGKAKLIRDDYCDGFGDCLPVCPADAISFVEREALPYDEEAVKENQRKAKEAAGQENTGAGKAGENSWAIDRADAQENSAAVPSRLRQWPVQIKLVQERASMFAGADLLVAADCTAYAYGNFHQDFIRDHVVLVGCTKLDDVDYSEKLARIFMRNDIKYHGCTHGGSVLRRNGACREDGAEREWKEDSGENRGDFYGGGNFVENQI